MTAPRVSDTPAMRGRGLTKTHRDRAALDHVDIDLHRGQATAIMGPSGSGKSTLLHILAGVLRPDDGEVWLQNERIDDWKDKKRSALRRKRFGFVFQAGRLLDELPADENVALPLMLDGHRRAEAHARADRWFEPLGIDGLQKRRPGQMSGGQMQRVAIARALVTDPEIVFADEPTGALDQAMGHEIIRLLVETATAHGRTLVVVTHDASVARHCARTVQLRDGKVVE